MAHLGTKRSRHLGTQAGLLDEGSGFRVQGFAFAGLLSTVLKSPW